MKSINQKQGKGQEVEAIMLTHGAEEAKYISFVWVIHLLSADLKLHTKALEINK